MTTRTWLALSLALNVAAVLAVVVAFRHRPAPTEFARAPAVVVPAPPVASQVAGHVETVARRTDKDVREVAGSGDIPRIWSRVEVADYKQYAANLRALGMPEHIVRDIVELDLMRSFGEQVSELVEQADPPFWQANSVRWRSKVGTADVARAVAEFQQVSRDTLGIDPSEWLWDQVSWMTRAESSRHRRYDDDRMTQPFEALLGFAEHSDGLEWLPKDRLDGLMRIRASFAAREEALERTRTDANSDAVDEQVNQLAEELKRAEDAYLTPAERQDRDLRENHVLINALAGVDLTRDEFARLAALDTQTNAEGEWRVEGTPQQAQALALLGRDRYNEVVRGYDEDYQGYLQACRSENLDPSLAAGLYAIRQQFDRDVTGLELAAAEPARLKAVAAIRDLVGTNALGGVLDHVSPTLRVRDTQSASPGTFKYVTERNMTLSELSVLFGIEVAELGAANGGMGPGYLIPSGTTLLIPVPSP